MRLSRPSLYYFAYAANMDPTQIEACCTSPKPVAVARITGQRLAFFGYTKTWDGAQETAIADPASELWGVVYELSEGDWETLDARMDARMDGTGAYFHTPATAFTPRGEAYPVLLYRKSMQGEAQKPSKEYLELIAQGARERGLPEAYVQALTQIESAPANYPVPRTRLVMPCQGGSDCTQCEQACGSWDDFA